MLIHDRLIAEGGWIERQGVTVFNLYRPPTIEHGDAAKAGPWLDHVAHGLRRATPNTSSNGSRTGCSARKRRSTTRWCSAAVQGIGKDTLLEPVKQRGRALELHGSVARSTCSAASTASSRSVILRISEARDLGDVDRFQFYDHMKAYTAAPPDVLRVDEKNLREHSVLNCCGVIITTNHKSGRHLPAGRRPPAFRRVVRPHEGRFRRRTTGTGSGAGTRDGGDRPRRRLSRRARHLGLRPESAAAEDRGVLGHRRRQPRAGRRRARRRARPHGQSRRHHARPHHLAERRAISWPGLRTGNTGASFRTGWKRAATRLCATLRQGRPVENQWRTAGRLREGHPLDPGPNQGRRQACAVMSVKIRNVFQARPGQLSQWDQWFSYPHHSTPFYYFIF